MTIILLTSVAEFYCLAATSAVIQHKCSDWREFQDLGSSASI